MNWHYSGCLFRFSAHIFFCLFFGSFSIIFSSLIGMRLQLWKNILCRYIVYECVLICVWLPRKSDFAGMKKIYRSICVVITNVVVYTLTHFPSSPLSLAVFWTPAKRNDYAFRRCSRSFFGSIWSVSWWNSTRIHSPIEHCGTCTNAFLHATLTGQFVRGVCDRIFK